MSFFIFTFGVKNQGGRPGGGDAFLSRLQWFMDESGNLAMPDGPVEFYPDDDGAALTHIHSGLVFDYLVEAARDADWIIVPQGCRTCLTSEKQRRHLPPEIADGAVLVSRGQDVLDVIYEE